MTNPFLYYYSPRFFRLQNNKWYYRFWTDCLVHDAIEEKWTGSKKRGRRKQILDWKEESPGTKEGCAPWNITDVRNNIILIIYYSLHHDPLRYASFSKPIWFKLKKLIKSYIWNFAYAGIVFRKADQNWPVLKCELSENT